VNKLSYKQKLIQFNSTPKYLIEMDFMIKLISPKQNEKVLDYGCGTGFMVEHLNDNTKAEVFGYDIEDYLLIKDKHRFRDSYHFKFDKVYFMHSIAHIENLELSLIYLKKNMLVNNGEIHIITPNKLWLDKASKKDYIPDTTVAEHFDCEGLLQLLKNLGYKIIHYGQFGKVLNDQHERIFVIAFF
jgi:2-polyprenyl-3-methyl-5-hydroxy-6-metoxy-1,4-benzoquinol methylase